MEKENILHPEITCPYCRIGFGAHKVSFKKVEAKTEEKKTGFFKSIFVRKENNAKEREIAGIIHLDPMWSADAGLMRDCTQVDFLKQFIESVDDHENPKFTADFKLKLNQLRTKFETNPDDISKENFSDSDYYIAFYECLNYGCVENEDEEEYDREQMKGGAIKKLYEDGVNLNDALRSFIRKIKTNETNPTE